MTALELVKEYFPNTTDKEANNVLWTCTGYPGFFMTSETKTVEDCLREQLAGFATRSGGDHIRACDLAHQDMDEAMSRHLARQASQPVTVSVEPMPPTE